jgi:hypothetical protein
MRVRQFYLLTNAFFIRYQDAFVIITFRRVFNKPAVYLKPGEKQVFVF